MARIVYEVKEQFVIDTECTEEELAEMSDDEILDLVERICQYGSDEGNFSTHTKEIAEVFDENENAVRTIEKQHD